MASTRQIEQNVPTISDLLKLQYKLSGSETFNLLLSVTKAYFKIRAMLYSKDKEIQKLEYLNENLIQSQKQRDQMITYFKDQNFQLNIKYCNFLQETQKQQSNNKNQNTFLLQNEEEKQKLKNFKAETQTLFEKNQSINSTIQQYQQLNLISQTKQMMESFNNTNSNENFNKFDVKIFQNLYDENLSNLHYALKYQKVYQSLLRIMPSPTLEEQIQRIRIQSKEIFDCSFCEIFLIDSEAQQLYTIKFENLDFIKKKLSIQCGQVSSKLSDFQFLNQNNKLDQKFQDQLLESLEIKINNTLSQLISVNDTVYAILLCANKNDGNFQSEDEKLMEQYQQVVGLIMQYMFQGKKQLLMDKSLRYALDTASNLFFSNNLADLLQNAKLSLTTYMNSEKVEIYLVDWVSNQFYNYEDGERFDYPITGIAEKTIYIKEMQKYIKPCFNVAFNPKVDIDTTCPIIYFGIYDSKNKFVAAVVQIQSQKGLNAELQQNNFPISQNEMEYLRYFQQHFLNSFRFIAPDIIQSE